MNRPQCHSCHGRHDILQKTSRASWIPPENLEKTCGTCHPEQTGKACFLPWLTSLQARTHPKQNFSRSYDRSDCFGCHQGLAVHGEKTVINDRDCYKCHLRLGGDSLLIGSIHPSGNGLRALVAIYGAAVILLSLGGLAFYIGLIARREQGR